MELKEISKDIYDVDAWLDEGLGKEGTPEREKIEKRHGRNITPKYSLRPEKMHVLRSQNLLSVLELTKAIFQGLNVG